MRSALAVLMLASVWGTCFLCCCTATQAKQVQTVDTTAIELTDAVCAFAPESPVGQPWVEIACTIAQGVEQGVNVVISDTQGKAAATRVTSLHFRMSAQDAPAFLAAHKGK